MAGRKEKGSWVYFGDGAEGWLPEVRITKDKSSYVYHPLRGHSAAVAVENIDEKIIGWMSVDDLPGGPYKNVKEWMKKKRIYK